MHLKTNSEKDANLLKMSYRANAIILDIENILRYLIYMFNIEQELIQIEG